MDNDELQKKIEDLCMERWSNGEVVYANEIVDLAKRELGMNEKEAITWIPMSSMQMKERNTETGQFFMVR